jgi:hypothetical protein
MATGRGEARSCSRSGGHGTARRCAAGRARAASRLALALKSSLSACQVQ